MAIPWLIGAAVVGVIAIASSDDDDNESEQRQRRRIRREAKEERREAKKREQVRQAEHKQQRLESFVTNKLNALLINYDIEIDSAELAISAIEDSEDFESEVISAFENSENQRNLNKNVTRIETELKNIEALYSQLMEI